MKLEKIHKNEVVLNPNSIRKLLKNKENDNMTTPTKAVYEQALETVKKYEDRQKVLVQLEKDLVYKLSKFTETKFKINKKEFEVLFSGLNKETGKIGIGKSVCDKEDKYEPVIGKLIAVKKALGEDVEEVVKHIESFKGLSVYTDNVGTLVLRCGNITTGTISKPTQQPYTGGIVS